MIHKLAKVLKRWLPAPIVAVLRVIYRRVYVPTCHGLLVLCVMLHIPLQRPHKKIRFEFHAAEHCNLNCVGCDHFSPLAEPGFLDLEVFRKDMQRMGEIFSHQCEWIHILGGEPLLNPEIITIMKITRENFSDGLIHIITNGILLPKMSDDFWKACHEYNIEVCMTYYPLKLDLDKIRATAEKYGAVFKYFGNDQVKDMMYKTPLDLSGKGDIRYNFAFCQRANNCMFLRDGRLYTCTMIPNVQFFNRAFNQNIPVTQEDYIDIYQDISAKEILKKLAQPVPICGYCNIKGRRNGIKWHVSTRNINEWV